MNDVQSRTGPGKRITLHFSVALSDGQLVDSTKAGNPATFTWGDGSLLPGFEAAVEGLKVGDRRSVYLTPEQAFGPWNESNVQRFPPEQFAGMELSIGLMVSFADAARSELPGVVTAIEDTCVTIDFNHPLAGRDLNFDVEIINVVDAASESIVLK